MDFGICIILAALALGLSNLFVYCYPSEMAAVYFEQLNDSICGANWPDLPVEVQKNFITIIENSAIPLYYDGFGITIANLETFGKVNFFLIFSLLNWWNQLT